MNAPAFVLAMALSSSLFVPSLPLYVVIDTDGVVRAGTNDLAKAEKALDGLLAR